MDRTHQAQDTENTTESNEVYLCADIGGTNTNLSIVSPALHILHISRSRTAEIRDIAVHVSSYKEHMQQQGYSIRRACFSIAGPLDHTRREAQMTNASLTINADEIERVAHLQEVRLINDFQAIAYATNTLRQQECNILQNGPAQGDVRAVIGAGTGLGQSIMYYDASKGFLPLHSEGGHANACATYREEMELLEYIGEQLGRRNVVEYEDVVSGKGLALIYSYFSGGSQGTPDKIAQCQDELSQRAFSTFVRFYARKAKALCLESYASGGLFIAGGIAAHNIERFDGFLEEFLSHDRFARFLRDIPVTVINNYDVSHRGAAYALKVNG